MIYTGSSFQILPTRWLVTASPPHHFAGRDPAWQVPPKERAAFCIHSTNPQPEYST